MLGCYSNRPTEKWVRVFLTPGLAFRTWPTVLVLAATPVEWPAFVARLEVVSPVSALASLAAQTDGQRP